MSIESQLSALMGDIPDGMTEGIALGTGLADGYDLYESAIGDVVVTFNPMGVSSLDIADDGFAGRFNDRFERGLLRATAPNSWGKYIPSAIEAGRPDKIPVDLRSVTPFQADVLGRTATIPRGEVRPYAWLANEVRRPNAVRAAGSAVAKNPIPLIIPCHRVVRADGHIGNYSLGGPDNKYDLLEHEGTNPTWLEALAAKHVRLHGDASTGIVCHPTCHLIRAANQGDVSDFRSLQDAQDQGFRPCEICRPT